MDRDEARLAELGAANRQHPVDQIDLLGLETECFANPQASDAEQTEQTVIRPRAQAAGRRQVERALEQARDILVRVEIWSRPVRAERQQARRRDLGLRVIRYVVAGKAPDVAQPLCLRGQLG